MTDTPPEIAELVRQKLMARSGEERFLMGVRSFDAARAMVLASLPAGLSPDELKHQLYQRIYGELCRSKTAMLITDSLRRNREHDMKPHKPPKR